MHKGARDHGNKVRPANFSPCIHKGQTPARRNPSMHPIAWDDLATYLSPSQNLLNKNACMSSLTPYVHFVS
jgi:hypothetical protein